MFLAGIRSNNAPVDRTDGRRGRSCFRQPIQGKVVRRGGVVFTLILGLLAAALAAEAQPSGKVYRIGLFHVGLDHVPPSLEGLRDGLKALGYDVGTAPMPRVSTVVNGSNVRLDWRNLADEEAARETAKEFVRDRVDLVVAFEPQTIRAAKAATSEIPIVPPSVLARADEVIE